MLTDLGNYFTVAEASLVKVPRTAGKSIGESERRSLL